MKGEVGDVAETLIEEEEEAIQAVSTRPQLNAINAIDWAISSMSAHPGIEK